jgi:hypothetical protein
MVILAIAGEIRLISFEKRGNKKPPVFNHCTAGQASKQASKLLHI